MHTAAEIFKLSRKYAYASIRMHESIAQKAGFASTDHKYLGFFIQRGKLTAGELAQLTGLTTGAVTGLINRLEKKALVKREADPHDQRKVIIHPDIPKMTALLAPFYQQFQSQTEQLIASFSEAEQAIIHDYLQKSLALAEMTYTHLNQEKK
jgi:DNA-binding MarR family transcriptional regulator